MNRTNTKKFLSSIFNVNKLNDINEYSNSRLIRNYKSIYSTEKQLITLTLTYSTQKKEHLIGDFRKNKLLKNQRLLNELKAII
ncbi:hypothetical protein RS022_07380 [Candidatus Phytoplasma rubi]|uniref:Uncharacterized protein n=1 Tax=Candidatus Phytoplasma rubi TaxID=399025 RepID=A0ABY7BSM2_9MOLU|nr:hypothetical protein RS022_07380 [Candidatus Phytoplasma rubi]